MSKDSAEFHILSSLVYEDGKLVMLHQTSSHQAAHFFLSGGWRIARVVELLMHVHTTATMAGEGCTLGRNVGESVWKFFFSRDRKFHFEMFLGWWLEAHQPCGGKREARDSLCICKHILRPPSCTSERRIIYISHAKKKQVERHKFFALWVAHSHFTISPTWGGKSARPWSEDEWATHTEQPWALFAWRYDDGIGEQKERSCVLGKKIIIESKCLAIFYVFVGVLTSHSHMDCIKFWEYLCCCIIHVLKTTVELAGDEQCVRVATIWSWWHGNTKSCFFLRCVWPESD